MHGEDMIRRGEGFVDVAAVFGHRVADVAVEFLMGERRAGFERILGIGHAGQRIVFDDDGMGGVFCLRSRLGGHGGNRHADAMHRAAGEHWMRGNDHVRQHLRRREIEFVAEIVAGNDQFDAGHGFGFAAVDGNNFRVRVRAALKREIEHARQLNIVGVAALAGNQRRIFDSLGRGADQSAGCVFGGHGGNSL